MRPCMRQLFLDIFSQILVLIADLGKNLRSRPSLGEIRGEQLYRCELFAH